MFTLKIENETEKVVELTQKESNYQVVSVAGLNPPNAQITTSVIAGHDGSRFISSKLEERNVVITLQINGDVERNRLFLYRYFKSKRWCKIYYSNESRNVYIEGYVETVETDLFEQNQQMQISIICPDPYFKDIQEIVTDISKSMARFEFPFAFGCDFLHMPTITDSAIEFSDIFNSRVCDIYNDGESDIGVIITITARDTVINPILYNMDTREYFGLKLTLEAGDKIVINTNQGEKSVTLERDGIITNQINNMTQGSSWFLLTVGSNMFTYDADEGEELLHIYFTHHTRYEAV